MGKTCSTHDNDGQTDWRPWQRLKEDIKLWLRRIGCRSLEWIKPAQDGVQLSRQLASLWVLLMQNLSCPSERLSDTGMVMITVWWEVTPYSSVNGYEDVGVTALSV
jgi:hypothetical protein